MAQYTRNPLPKDIIWRQDKHRRFYWLATDKLHPAAVVRATLDGQQIKVQPGDVDKLILRLNDDMLNLDKEIRVVSQDKEIFKGRVDRTIAAIAATLDERGDPAAIFSSQVVVSF